MIDDNCTKKGFHPDLEPCREKRSRRNSSSEAINQKGRRSRTNSLSEVASQKGKRSISTTAAENNRQKISALGKCNGQKCIKEVSFNMDLNVYIEPIQKGRNRSECNMEMLKVRRNGVSVIKRDSYEVLRILSMYTSWRLAQLQKGRRYEDFPAFLERASPKLYDRFFRDSEALL